MLFLDETNFWWIKITVVNCHCFIHGLDHFRCLCMTLSCKLWVCFWNCAVAMLFAMSFHRSPQIVRTKHGMTVQSELSRHQGVDCILRKTHDVFYLYSSPFRSLWQLTLSFSSSLLPNVLVVCGFCTMVNRY